MKEQIDKRVADVAKRIVVAKLEKQGINYKDLDESDYDFLVGERIKILTKDVKSIGITAAISAAITLVTGF